MKIIMIDDCTQDCKLAFNAVQEMGLENSFSSISGLTLAREMLEQSQFLEPTIIFIDLNFPNGSGFEILELLDSQIKTNPFVIPIVLSTSFAAKDVLMARHCGAVSYFVKPDDYQEWIDLISSSVNYWKFLNAYPDLKNL